MKIERNLNSTTLQDISIETSEGPDKSNGGDEDVNKDKITISKEARNALSERTGDVDIATELIEKVSSSYPDKDLTFKLNDLEIEATEPRRPNHIGNMIGSLLNTVIK